MESIHSDTLSPEYLNTLTNEERNKFIEQQFDENFIPDLKKIDEFYNNEKYEYFSSFLDGNPLFLGIEFPFRVPKLHFFQRNL